MRKVNPQDAPSGLSAEARAWWKKLTHDYVLSDAAGLLLLETAMHAFDRMNQAAALIKKHGAVITDRFGQLRANPAVIVERDARSAMLTALRGLQLDMGALQQQQEDE